MARRDQSPATTGHINIVNNLLTVSTIYYWPVFSHTTGSSATDVTGSPAMDVTIRVRSDGEMFLAIHETWPD